MTIKERELFLLKNDAYQNQNYNNYWRELKESQLVIWGTQDSHFYCLVIINYMSVLFRCCIIFNLVLVINFGNNN